MTQEKIIAIFWGEGSFRKGDPGGGKKTTEPTVIKTTISRYFIGYIIPQIWGGYVQCPVRTRRRGFQYALFTSVCET